VLAEGRRAPDCQPALRRRAAEALAIHHEHRARDLRSAHRYASTLNGGGSRRQQQDFERRLARLRRKMSGASADRSLQLDE
jgi:hypothetical protein